jgi:hypothetical protein
VAPVTLLVVLVLGLESCSGGGAGPEPVAAGLP